MSLIDLHPMLVHFPIALALVALLFNVAGYRFRTSWLETSAIALTVLAALGAIAAVTSGALFTKPTAGLAATLKAEHVMYAGITTTLLAIAAIAGLLIAWKLKDNVAMKWIFTALLFGAAVGVSLTGMKGGEIVYHVWLF